MKAKLSIEQKPTVSPQLVLYQNLLQLSSVELRQAISQELAENPALELNETLRCAECGDTISDGYCPSCGRVASPDLQEDAFRDEEPVPHTDVPKPDSPSTPAKISLPDHLLHQVRMQVPSQDLPIAKYLVRNLDDRGLLDCEVSEVASLFEVKQARVEAVLSAIQTLDPPGIAARDVRECLAIQLRRMRRDGRGQPLAEEIVVDHWEALSERAFKRIVEATDTTIDDVRRALRFIKSNLNPFPAHADWATVCESPPQETVTYVQPDISIRKDSAEFLDEGYEVRLQEASNYGLQLSTSYREALKGLEASETDGSADGGLEQWEKFYTRARLFIKSIQQRRETLYRIATRLVDYQREFLAYGDKRLRPLTRAQLADMVGVHESTVSRAVAGKYVRLPDGRVIPMEVFFDKSVPIKARIRDWVAEEGAPLSDRQIADKLAQQGYNISRRTVAKYRNEMNVLPSYLRRFAKKLDAG